jgi:hypothetical protein
MSDFSGLEQSFSLPAAGIVPPLCEPPPLTTDLQPEDVGMRRLRTPREIARILHLRGEIRLPTSALSDAGFATREKKETKRGWSVPSSVSASTSVPSATCR